ncbi:tetratricopeptide repeat protein 5-like [Plodia interpunctella]|uniref:tetratricopeptide repeat protein 5-like n=1 Tax=Plodia interpunctella TaxID=58824 RepID=UPI0023678AFF|nr:tetratricopeptide repeat protein 5-like [Plodia interpunctella]
MSRETEDEAEILENVTEVVDGLAKELKELYSFRDLFFENHPLEMAREKNKYVEEKKNVLVEKFEAINVDTQIPFSLRAQFLYMKGRCYNISITYDPRATQCLSKAVKLNPRLVDAWNELGECYWKNMNVKEAKASFEGALKHERNRLSLRCLSIILRQENGDQKRSEASQAILKSVEFAKEAVALDIKDGVSWSVLGNAYLCQFFLVAQEPATLKLCMSAYKQAWLDPVAKGQPDLYYNKGVALKYEEQYAEALENFEYACRLDPPWETPKQELSKLTQYLIAANDLVRTKGKIKTKKLTQMVQSIDKKMLGAYASGTFHTFGARKDVSLDYARLDQLQNGANECKVILGKVVGSIHNENSVPFTFAIVDSSMECVCVTVYNWAHGRGAIIGDCVCVPEPLLTVHQHDSPTLQYSFKSIRLNNPLLMLVNGKRVSRNQFASTQVSSTYELQ